MKRYLPHLLLFCFSLTAVWCNGQWYSYDAFDGKNLTKTQLKQRVIEKTPDSILLSSSMPSDFKSIVKRNQTVLKTALRQFDKDSILIILERQKRYLKSRIDTASKSTKDSLQKVLDSLQASSDQRVKTGKDSLRIALASFRYLKSQYQNISLFPVGSSYAAQSYFDNADTLFVESDSNVVFSFENAYLNYLPNAKTLAAYTEPLGDYLGPVRISLGLLLTAPAAKEDTITTEKFDRKQFNEKFKSGGGNVSLNFGYPLLHAHISKYFDLKSYCSPRLSLDVPKNGQSINQVPLHAQWLAFENQVKVSTLQGNFIFLFCHRFARVSGNSTFYDRMGFTGEDRKTFNFSTMTAGFIAKKKLALYYTWYTGSSRIVKGIGNNGSITANIQLD